MGHFVCPFCGDAGKRTDEHLWAQWLRQTEGAKALLQDSHGERIPIPSDVVARTPTDATDRSQNLKAATRNCCHTCRSESATRATQAG